jgi:hypothetical protein
MEKIFLLTAKSAKKAQRTQRIINLHRVRQEKHRVAQRKTYPEYVTE